MDGCSAPLWMDFCGLGDHRGFEAVFQEWGGGCKSLAILLLRPPNDFCDSLFTKTQAIAPIHKRKISLRRHSWTICRTPRPVDSQKPNLLPNSAEGKNVQMIEFLRQHPLLLLAGIFILGTASLECALVLRSRRRSREWWECQRNKIVQALIVRLTVNNAIHSRLNQQPRAIARIPKLRGENSSGIKPPFTHQTGRGITDSVQDQSSLDLKLGRQN